MNSLSIDQIHQAADEIIREGGTVSQRKIRERLGCGSYSSIGAALRLWTAESQPEEKEKDQSPNPIPPHLESMMQESLSKIWNESVKLSMARLNDEIEKLKSDRDSIIRERQMIFELSDSLQSDLDQSMKISFELRTELEAAQEARKLAETILGESRTRSEELFSLLEKERERSQAAQEAAATAAIEAAELRGRLAVCSGVAV